MVQSNDNNGKINLLGDVPNKLKIFSLLVFSVIIFFTLWGMNNIKYSDIYEIDIMIKKDTINRHFFGISQVEPDRIWIINNATQVDIALFMYPQNKYGKVIGKIDGITNDKNDKLYIRIDLENGLITSNNFTLDYIPGMMLGVARVKVKEKSILKRIFSFN